MKIQSLRTFIGAKDFELSRSFYKDLGFKELPTSNKMSFLVMGRCGFYLQDYYVRDWVDNTMLFLEVENTNEFLKNVQQLKLPSKYKSVKLSGIHENDWGKEFFLHDPSGVLWHIGEFYR